MPHSYEPWNGPTGSPQPPLQTANQQAANPQTAYQQPVTSQQAANPQAANPQAAYQQPAQAQQVPPQPQVVYAMPPQKKSRGWIVALVFVLCFFALMAFTVKSCTDMMGNMGYYSAGAGDAKANSVAVLNIDGTIQYDGTANSPEGFKTLLDRAADDANVHAVVLRVNSGGGTATAGEEMATYLREFKEKSGKPVVVSSASINASAAYEISSQADYIYVAKSTEIGAIGTAMQLTDLSGLMDMLGVKMDVITSADSKDSSYGYRPLTDEEREYYQHMIDQINELFIENVAEGRNMSVEDVRKLATGLAFTGVDAVNNGLADEVGTLDGAKRKAADLAGLGDYNTYSLTLSSYDLSSLYDLFGYTNSEDQKALPLLKQ